MALGVFSILSLLLSFAGFSNAAVFTLQNKCNKTIWPGIQTGGGKPQLRNSGLELQPGETATFVGPTGWSGRIWPRTGCKFDQSGQHGNCTTGDCGGILECGGGGGTPPVSLAEFTLENPLDYYDVSLVDGFNLPISIYPSGGSGNCSAVKCSLDLNVNCAEKLQVKGITDGEIVACKSACLAFGEPEYCCTGEYNSPKLCKPSNYSEVFKKACPTSYSYPYDDSTSTFTCKGGANYSITFC